MGFIGWRFFSDDDSPEAISACRDWEAAERAAARRAAKVRQKRHEARRRQKQALQEEYYRQAQEFQEQFNKTFEVSESPFNERDANDPCVLYNKFSPSNKEAYRDEVTRRYGYLYNSYTDGEAPKINRGLGPACHQGVKRPQNVKHHAPLGPIGPRIRITIGWQPNSQGQNSQSVAAAKMENSAAGSLRGAGGSGKLNRPF